MKRKASIAGVGRMLSTARRLRTARAACTRFLMLWVIQQSGQADSPHERAISDPSNHDWALLYLGSVLDD